MIFKVLNKQEIKHIFDQEMKYDFPAAELKPLNEIYRMLDTGIYEGRGLYEDNELLAYVFISFATHQDVALIDYLAVCSKHRGNGIGSKLISIIREELSKWRGVILEVENPKFALNGADYHIQCSRINFYQKNNIKLSDVKTSLYGVPFNIMYFADFALKKVDVQRRLEEIYGVMFPKDIYDKCVRFSD